MTNDDKSDKFRKAVALKVEGLSDAAIAREIGVSRQAVWAWFNKRPRVLSEKSKTTRREYMRGYMSKRRREDRLAKLMS